MPHTHYVPLTWEPPGRWWPQRVDEGSSPGSAGTTGHPDPPQEGLKALPSSRASTTSALSGPDPSCGFGKDLNRNGRNPRTSQTSSFKVPIFISARMKMGSGVPGQRFHPTRLRLKVLCSKHSRLSKIIQLWFYPTSAMKRNSRKHFTEETGQVSQKKD